MTVDDEGPPHGDGADDPAGPSEPADPFGPDDPFDSHPFDEAWVAGALHHEPSARFREAQAGWDRAEVEREEQEARAWRQRRRRRRRGRALILLSLLLFSAAVAIADRRPTETTTWATTSGDTTSLVLGGRPTAAPASSSEPLGAPADPDASGGTYAFTATQPGSDQPVTYDPCRPVEIVINDREAPPGTRAIVDRAVARAATVSGLQLTITGSTDEPASARRSAYQPKRYGDRWAPVLLAWTDPGEVPDLGGDVVGLGGSVSSPADDGRPTYVSGIVLLDAPDATTILRRDGGAQQVEDIVLHELGHLLGLDHVGSEDELMFPAGRKDVHGYQRGARAGLTRLGQGTCVSLL